MLQNIITLEDGVPAVMHFESHMLQTRRITDRLTGEPKDRSALVFEVDELNGNLVNAEFSVVSERLAALFEPWLPEMRYRNFNFIVTRRGSGFQTEYELQPLPRGEPPAAEGSSHHLDTRG